jgi:hypothetical protein
MADADVPMDETGGSRRDFIKRSAIVGGALVWAAPAVQTIGMRAAAAQTISPPDAPCDTQIAMNINDKGQWIFDGDGDFTAPDRCDLAGCSSFGSTADLKDLKTAVTTAKWWSLVTIDGKQAFTFDLKVLADTYNGFSVNNIHVNALALRTAGKCTGLPAQLCEPVPPPTGQQFTVTRGDDPCGVQTVSLCLCAQVI